MKLTVVIVNYNVCYYLEQCLLSVQKALEGIEGEIYVVDNHSKDGSVAYLSARFPAVHFIDSNHNLGFARANNIAIRQSCGEYVLLLNPDTIVGEHTLSDVLQFMDAHPQAGGAGVMMHNTDGSRANESRRAIPTPMVSFRKMLGFNSRYYMSHLPWDKPGRIEVISGAFCMLRRRALDQVGLLDEDFFMYGEDIDLSYRLLKGGFENWYIPSPILQSCTIRARAPRKALSVISMCSTRRCSFSSASITGISIFSLHFLCEPPSISGRSSRLSRCRPAC